MAYLVGTLHKCDRCGEEMFIAEGGDLNGTMWKTNVYRSMPDNWNDHLAIPTKLLCPRCSQMFSDMIAEFME